MIRGLKKVAPTWYTPVAEKDESDPTTTRFKLRPMTPAETESCMNAKLGELVFPPSVRSKIIQYGLVDWENVPDGNGELIECIPMNYDEISIELRGELSGEIISMSILSEADRKN